MRTLSRVFLLAALCLSAIVAHAHHSFAVYFDANQIISRTGVAESFAFRNPHGILVFKVKNKDGVEEEWKAETNSPSLLMRRGWSKDSVKAGETITVEGWPARDGSKLIRIRKVTRANGETIGSVLDPTQQK